MIIKKVRAIEGRVERLRRLLKKCQGLSCPIANRVGHEVGMIEKAASEIIEELRNNG